MQRVANCIYIENNKVLMLQKPRRGWWSAPGGKMDAGESVAVAAMREFYEETGLQVESVDLVGIFTVIIMDGETNDSEWMFYNFKASKSTGSVLTENEEGILRWHDVNGILDLPMAEGDKIFLAHAIKGDGIIIGTFTYTKDMELLNCDYSLHNKI